MGHVLVLLVLSRFIRILPGLPAQQRLIIERLLQRPPGTGVHGLLTYSRILVVRGTEIAPYKIMLAPNPLRSTAL